MGKLIKYIPSDSKTVQGKRNDVYRKYGKYWRIQNLGGGNGNWLLTKPSDVLVDGESYRDFVLEHYKRQYLTENLAELFREEVESGKLEL